MKEWPGNWKHGQWLQYKGWKRGSLFFGVGEQKDKRHLIISSSGSESNGLAGFVKHWKGLYCTRIDVQRTIERPKHMSLRRIRKATGKANTTIIQSPDNDTLYIGSRTSDIFTRLYEKPLDTMYLRLEFELKGKRARAAWQAISHGKTPSHIFSHYLDASALPDTVGRWFAKPDDDLTFAADKAQVVLDASKKLAWIWSLDQAMERAMNDHEIGVQVREIVRMWNEIADRLDE
jgi:hypothetical protein